MGVSDAIVGLGERAPSTAGALARGAMVRLRGTIRSLVQFSGRNWRSATITGTSPRASVSDTSVWQLAVLPRAEAYCEATPTECVPFFDNSSDFSRHIRVDVRSPQEAQTP